MISAGKNHPYLLFVICLALLGKVAAAPTTAPFSGTPSALDTSVDPSGNAFVVALVSGNIEALIYQTNGTWSPLFPLYIRGGAEAPVIKTDSNGNALVLWFQSNSGFDMMAAYYSASDKTWSPAETISGSSISTPSTPNVEFFGNSGAMGLWEVNNGGTAYIESALFDQDTQTWGSSTATLPQTGTISNTHFGVNDQGDALVVWRLSSAPYLFGASFDGGSKLWGFADPFPNPAGDDRTFLTFALSSASIGVASWLESSGGTLYLRSTRLNVPLVIPHYYPSTFTSVPPIFLFNIEMAISPSGNAFLIWQENGGGSINGANFNGLTGQGSTPTNFARSNPAAPLLQIGADGFGNGVGIWRLVDGADNIIQRATYSAGSQTWGSPSDLYTTTNTVSELSFSINAVGNTATVWLEGASTFLLLDNTPAAPSNLQVAVTKNRFTFQTEFAHTVSWSPSTSPSIASYKFYVNGELFAELGANQLSYTVHNCPPKNPVTYQVVAVSSNGGESSAASITYKGK